MYICLYFYVKVGVWLKYIYFNCLIFSISKEHFQFMSYLYTIVSWSKGNSKEYCVTDIR